MFLQWTVPALLVDDSAGSTWKWSCSFAYNFLLCVFVCQPESQKDDLESRIPKTNTKPDILTTSRGSLLVHSPYQHINLPCDLRWLWPVVLCAVTRCSRRTAFSATALRALQPASELLSKRFEQQATSGGLVPECGIPTGSTHDKRGFKIRPGTKSLRSRGRSSRKRNHVYNLHQTYFSPQQENRLSSTPGVHVADCIHFE